MKKFYFEGDDTEGVITILRDGTYENTLVDILYIPEAVRPELLMKCSLMGNKYPKLRMWGCGHEWAKSKV